ncbi:hypothetical protein TRSC58_07337 [Trypanosoma rangeli SC58]|uniref:Uncharacterized protein n=1 Tax=Trypanosoma rangeli SC58 TaxID=429131 RepID=A0A061IVQ0_TRYRA|nr:hypothetical protein TRSC58_07337 [Trypanosoma rangeli SC58]
MANKMKNRKEKHHKKRKKKKEKRWQIFFFWWLWVCIHTTQKEKKEIHIQRLLQLNHKRDIKDTQKAGSTDV